MDDDVEALLGQAADHIEESLDQNVTTREHVLNALEHGETPSLVRRIHGGLVEIVVVIRNTERSPPT